MATNSRKGFELHEILRGGILRKFHTSRRFSRRRVVRNWSAGRPVAAVTDGISTNRFAYDTFGSVTNETQNGIAIERTYDNCGRLVAMTAAHYDYSSFGKTLIATGFLRNRNPFRFSSEYVDDATGLIYYNWRHYDPVHGRWLSEDPMFGELATDSRKMIDSLGIEGEIPYNPYLMCNNNPLGLFDITGEIVPVAVAGWADADAVAAAIETAIVTLTAWVGTAIVADLAKKTECRKPRCAPCDPPVGTIGYRIDLVPPGKPHWPYTGSHIHLYKVHQSPVESGCGCFWNKEGLMGGTIPPPGSVSRPDTPVSGGGVIF